MSFLLTQKLEVKGPNQHPIYKWLTDKNQNSVKSTSVKWNFQKYLIDEDGKFIDVHYDIPAELTRDNNKLTITFKPHPVSRGGPFFKARTIKR